MIIILLIFLKKQRKKAAIVERFNRTLKSEMWKYFYHKGTRKWIDKLQDFTFNYNNTVHSTIHMKPAEVNKDNQLHV
jgi:hypothetical protein